MPLKDLLVLVDGSKRAEMRLELASDLARRHEASLTGLHVPDIVQPGADPGRVLSPLEMSRMPDDLRDQTGWLEHAFWKRVKQIRSRRNGGSLSVPRLGPPLCTPATPA
jgi:hypothetical protein